MTDPRDLEALEQALAHGDLVMGELVLRKGAAGYSILGPNSGRDAEPAPAGPDALRAWVRVDGSGNYRPLTGARGMRSNWRWQHPDAAMLLRALDAVYPLAWRHRCLHQRKTLRITPAAEVLSRQSGRYETAGRLDRDGVDEAASCLCRRCVRTPVWHHDIPDAGLPCPEPCSVFVALARAAAEWSEQDPDPGEDDDPAAGFADFDHPGNEIRNEVLRLRRSG